jgi:High potential iron-sulfur protein
LRLARQGPRPVALPEGGRAIADAVSRAARRRFLKLAAAGIGAAPLAMLAIGRRARAQQKVSEDDELARELGYRQDASTVDASKWPLYEKGHVCAKCQQFHGRQGDEWGPCDIFGGKLVRSKGWCSEWVERGS